MSQTSAAPIGTGTPSTGQTKDMLIVIQFNEQIQRLRSNTSTDLEAVAILASSVDDMFTSLYGRGKLTYCCWCIERGDSGNYHAQCFIQLAKKSRFTTVQNLINSFYTGTPHPWNPTTIRISGSPQSNRTYVFKEETTVAGYNPKELGQLRLGGQGKRNDIIECKDAIKRGAPDSEVVENWPGLAIRYPNGLKFMRIALDCRTLPNVRTSYYFYGQPGAGKTYHAKSFARDLLRAGSSETSLNEIDSQICWISPPSGGQLWWTPYTGQRVLILDEYSSWIDWSNLMRLTEPHPNPYQLNTKGGNTWFTAEYVIFTGNVRPDRLHEKIADRAERFEGWRRRLAGNIFEIERAMAETVPNAIRIAQEDRWYTSTPKPFYPYSSIAEDVDV